MKTSRYFIDDAPLQILFFDKNSDSGHNFFNSGLGTIWFDYDLHLIENLAEATGFLQPVKQKQRALDLLFISNTAWFEGGEQLVKQIRSSQHIAHLPVYCITSCCHKLTVDDTNCMDKCWCRATNSDEFSKLAPEPFEPYLTTSHQARLHGVLYSNNITDQVSTIIDDMSQYWFNSGTA
ncbi:MAG: hypothetical protein GY927_09120 [bacterium]|nr:hypothetical protein [bacterium]